jgi:hypothetical protein
MPREYLMSPQEMESIKIARGSTIDSIPQSRILKHKSEAKFDLSKVAGNLTPLSNNRQRHAYTNQ